MFLANYMNTTGWDVDEAIVPLFAKMPDFSEAYTRYQVLHSASHGYKPANCQKLKAAGMCPADCGAKNPASITLAFQTNSWR